MENEYNNYHINNPDGVLRKNLNDGKLRFGNDAPRFIKEAPTSAQKELSRPNESFSRNDRSPVGNQIGSGTNGTSNNADAIKDLSSSLTSATGTLSTAATATATATTGATAATTVGSTIASAIGSGIGAIAGVAASAVVTAFIVVAVFISTLSVNLSLVMADVDCLVFRLEMQNAQAQDFENGVYAVLESNDGSHFEQQITADSIFVTFTGLKANREYMIRVQSDEKVFTEKSYITASSRISRGKINVRSENKDVFINVSDVVLGTEEIFTVTATDLQGNVLFVKDDNNANGSYAFSVSESKLLHCTLSIAGAAIAVADIEVKDEPLYNFDAPSWTWTDDTATLSFADLNGGNALIIPAIVTSVITEPTCEEDGYIAYTATAEANGKTYSDVKVVVSEGSALGHDYSSEPEFIWTPLSGAQNAASNDDDAVTILGYAVAVKFYCTHNHEHVHVVNIDPEDVRHEMALPSCIEDGFIIYYASVVYNETEYEDEHVDVLSATGHAYGASPVFTWTEDNGEYSVEAAFVCANDHDHSHDIVLETEILLEYTEPTCEEDGYTTYTATAIDDNGIEYTDTKIGVDEETALGHDYSEAEFIWTLATDDTTSGSSDDIPQFTVTVKFHCVHNSAYVSPEVFTIEPEYIDYTIDPATCEEDGKITYYAVLLYHDNQYRDQYEVVLPALGHDYPDEPDFTWVEDGDSYSITAVFVCNNDPEQTHNIVLETTPTREYTDPTCEEDGYWTYTATVTYNGKNYSDTKIVTDEETALGHSFEADGEWVDNDDGTFTVTAIITCENCSFHDTYPVESTSIWEDTTLYTPATCESDGQRVYNAGFDYNGNGVFSLTHTVVLPALGHDYGAAPVFVWVETSDGFAATAKYVCANNEEHVIPLETKVTPVYTPPTCEEDGYTTYTATAVDENGVEYTDVKVVTEDDDAALGHDYGEPEFIWSELNNGFGAVAVFTCSRCDHEETVNTSVYRMDNYDCTNGGTIVYYAGTTFEGVDYQDEKAVEVQPGHHYTMPVFHWIYDGSTYEVELYLFCNKNDAHIGAIPAELTSTEENDYTIYTATATYNDVEYTEQKRVRNETTEKELVEGGVYLIGDTIVINGTTYFRDDYASASLFNMSGSTKLESMLPAGYDGGNTSLSESEYSDVLDYDRITFNNGTYVRVNDDELGSINGLGYYESSFVFDKYDGEYSLIGVTVVSGSGTQNDPYVLNPVYGVTVTFNGNDGVFNHHDGSSITYYYTAQEVEDGLYIDPCADTPEASGRILRGWAKDRDGLMMFNFENTAVTEDIDLYAQWYSI